VDYKLSESMALSESDFERKDVWESLVEIAKQKGIELDEEQDSLRVVVVDKD
jgi:hypothetical protein